MNIAGKRMKGWIMLATKEIDKDRDLEKYVRLAESFAKTLPPK
jgi:hypothetical protein